MLEALVEELPPGGARADALLLLASAQQSFERCLELAESALEDAEGDDARIAKIECYVGEILLVQGAPDERSSMLGRLWSRRSGPAIAAILATALATVAWFETASAVEPTSATARTCSSFSRTRQGRTGCTTAAVRASRWACD